MDSRNQLKIQNLSKFKEFLNKENVNIETLDKVVTKLIATEADHAKAFQRMDDEFKQISDTSNDNSKASPAELTKFIELTKNSYKKMAEISEKVNFTNFDFKILKNFFQRK